MTDIQDRDPRQPDRRSDDRQRYDMHEINRRMRLWELANSVLCVLFLWAPMAAAAFHRAG